MRGPAPTLSFPQGEGESYPFHVYLSHAHEDFLLVDRVWRVLDRLGLRAYMYEHFPHPGRPQGAVVLQALRDSHHIVAFLTEAGNGSAWVHQELGAAMALGKYLLPVIQGSGVQLSGFAELRQPVLYEPRHPEVAIGRLLWLLRVDFELFDGALSVQCPSCQGHFSVPLPALHLVRQAMDTDRLLGRYGCPGCASAVHLSPWTLEPVSEQMALGRAWAE
ncbi:MAG: toll/interleukin-1 receptor domain-containing protein [Chloroflexi bacterium]|nr:toll/interleukin-1 receptor domain-containing protein [Chloroflexota bacterium]